MLETMIAIGVVLLAAACVGISLYRIVTGHSRGSGCCAGGAGCRASGGCAETARDRAPEGASGR